MCHLLYIGVLPSGSLCDLSLYEWERVMEMEIYEIIRGLREDKDLTQQNMADMLQIGRTMYRRYETGETEIPIRHLKTICLFFGVSADYLLGLPNGLRKRK